MNISRFKQICEELSQLIPIWEGKLAALHRELITNKKNSQQRTIRQIVGHMVDSASNNTHRIIHLQYQESPISYPDYANLGNNDRWIAIQNYQEENWEELVQLWASVHRHLIHVIQQVREDKIEQVWVSALQEEVSLKDMIMDFPRHFKLHLQEIEALCKT